MAVTTPRETWTEPRLDGLSKEVKDGFEAANKKMDAEFAKVDKKFDKVDERFDKVDERFDKLDEKFDRKFDRLTWGLLATAVALVTSLLGVIATLVATHAV